MYDTSANFFLSLYSEHYNLYNLIPTKLRGWFSIDYYYSVLLYTSIIFYCWFKPISHLSKNVTNRTSLNILIIISFLSIIYRDIMDLNRFYLSISISIYYLYYIRSQHKSFLTLLFFLFLSVLTHSFSIVIFVSYFISSIFNNKSLYSYYILTCLIIGVFFGNLTQSVVLSILHYSGLDISLVYFGEGSWGHNEYSNNTLLRKILECTIVLVLSLTSLRYKQRESKKDINVNLILILSGICLLFFSFKTLFERAFISLCLYSIYLFTLNIKNNILKYLILLLFAFRFIMINFVRYGDVFLSGHTDVLPDFNSKIEVQLKPLYYPTPFLLDIDNGYSDEFIIKNSIWK
ncbi:EpsG family protein [Providencia rettgeri]|uniref:EpsG family protein n=1 Tax=Providencia rettgeri TaxID=587 RepID=UPI0035CD4E41